MKMTADERARRCTANLYEGMRAAGKKVEQANVRDAMAAAIAAAVHVETQEMARVIDALRAPRVGSDADSAVVAARALRLAFDATVASAASLRAQLDAVRAAVIECAYCNGVGEMVRLPGDVTEPCPACSGLREALCTLPSTPDPAGTASAALDWMRSPAAPFVWNFDLHGEGDLAALLAAYAAHVLSTRANPNERTTMSPNERPDNPPEPILQFFAYEHLPPHLAEVSRPFCELAKSLVDPTAPTCLPRNPERTVALRKLLEAKDAAVRAALFK